MGFALIFCWRWVGGLLANGVHNGLNWECYITMFVYHRILCGVGTFVCCRGITLAGESMDFRRVEGHFPPLFFSLECSTFVTRLHCSI